MTTEQARRLADAVSKHEAASVFLQNARKRFGQTQTENEMMVLLAETYEQTDRELRATLVAVKRET